MSDGPDALPPSLVGEVVAAALVVLALPAGCSCQEETGLRVTVEGTVTRIPSLRVRVMGPDRTDMVDFGLEGGEPEIALPTRLGVRPGAACAKAPSTACSRCV